MKNFRYVVVLSMLLSIALIPSLRIEAATAGSEPQYSVFCQGETKVIGLTFLKSHDADPQKLISFLQKNWFEMDRIAAEQGLLTSYDMLSKDGDAEADWNVAVVVGYPSTGGYADIAAGFEKIRAAHEVVAIEGLTKLSDFGKFVGGSELEVVCSGS